jgi:hypothetical protein
LAIGLLPESFSIKVKVLWGGFGLWLGDNIVILSMVKQAHPLFITGYGPTLSSDSLIAGFRRGFLLQSVEDQD